MSLDADRSSDRPSRRVLVTGGAGFIGSHLVERLLALGDSVVVVDDLSTGRRANLRSAEASAAPGRLQIVESDLRRYLEGPSRDRTFDRIFHLAAAVGVRKVMDDPISAIRTNIEQTHSLLDFANAAGKPPTLIASSSEVYGKGVSTPFREDDDVLYGPTTMTRWSYACSKAIDEHLAISFQRLHALPCVIVRFFNTIGPRQVGEHGMVLPRFVHAALDHRPLSVYGDGSQSRTFCDVRDVVQALPTLLNMQSAYGRVFNLGSEQVVSVRDLARLVIATLGSPSIIQTVPYNSVFAEGFEELQVRRPDVSRVRDCIGFRPTISLEQSIRDIARHMTDDAGQYGQGNGPMSDTQGRPRTDVGRQFGGPVGGQAGGQNAGPKDGQVGVGSRPASGDQG